MNPERSMSTGNPTLTPVVSSNDHAQGRTDAPITLVEYGDYECPYCGLAYPIVKRVQARFGERLRFVFRNFPIAEAHPHAVDAAELAEAAALQEKFWGMHDTLFEHQRALTPADLQRYATDVGLNFDELELEFTSGEPQQAVRADLEGGIRSGVTGTPTFFVNGYRFVVDWRSEESFAAALDAFAPGLRRRAS
jgi:protein-disulfide isomerase